ncbi:tRNA (cytidine(34)-2'-O)-methyltransferase [Dongia deserti]|uniref:tRNA (cytidine(34)-2'-O)-methyltransferase n=1 Tax=Dongia deserti TaxID=2268030 RepID=UPI000E6571A5|nr:tRNA (cytidine(34)-2'-O)-methyltransferase [Dongia deserti]
MRLALYQPDIPQNTGAILRLAACFGLPVDLIEPCGFVFDDRRLRRAGMDYLEHVELHRHRSWDAYQAARTGRPGRLVLLTTKAPMPHVACRFEAADSLLFGRESAGVPDDVHAAADLRIRIPMRPGLRSLNVAMAAAIVTGEAMRQLGFPSS